MPAEARKRWYWDRRRNQSVGWWRTADNSARVGPIPLDENGRPLFVPAPSPDSVLVELTREELNVLVDAYLPGHSPEARDSARAALRAALEQEAPDGV